MHRLFRVGRMAGLIVIVAGGQRIVQCSRLQHLPVIRPAQAGEHVDVHGVARGRAGAAPAVAELAQKANLAEALQLAAHLLRRGSDMIRYRLERRPDVAALVVAAIDELHQHELARLAVADLGGPGETEKGRAHATPRSSIRRRHMPGA